MIYSPLSFFLMLIVFLIPLFFFPFLWCGIVGSAFSHWGFPPVRFWGCSSLLGSPAPVPERISTPRCLHCQYHGNLYRCRTVNLWEISQKGAQLASIGSAGTNDAFSLSGITGVFLSY